MADFITNEEAIRELKLRFEKLKNEAVKRGHYEDAANIREQEVEAVKGLRVSMTAESFQVAEQFLNTYNLLER